MGVLRHFAPWDTFGVGLLAQFGSKNQTRKIVTNHKNFEL